METWSNWAGSVTVTPTETVRPASVAEVQRVVADATGPVKAVGSGHSFTPIAVATGTQLRLDRLTGLVAVDRERCTATVLAGTTIAELNRLLDGQDMALSNLGDIDKQTIAGAIGTGTHGTGAAFTGLAGMVTALDLVTADGEVRHLSAETPDELAAARVGLGALGVVTALTLQCEPSYLLRAVERPAGLDEMLERFDDWVGGHDHAELYWFPHTRRVLTKTNDRVPGPARPLSRTRAWIDDELMSNRVFAGLQRAVTAVPRLAPKVNQLASRALTARQYVDTSHRVFCAQRRVRFHEMEYAIPRASLEHVLGEAQRWLDRTGETVAFPVEIRVAAPDDIWLSTGYDRANVYVAFHQYVARDHSAYFAAVEAVLRDVDGRPHWGKLHTLTAADLEKRYPRFGDFLAVRDRLDPDRRFANDYLRRVLGD
ncbi:D-arabinono-1,4-lactone oxidase [soil metagenome]